MKINNEKEIKNQEENQEENIDEMVNNEIDKTEESKEEILDPKLKKNIEKWKKQYKHIYKNVLDENTNEFIIWRPMNRKEYKEIVTSKDLSLLDSQELTVKKVLLYPSNAEELIDARAGIATILSEEILENSGFNISKSTTL